MIRRGLFCAVIWLLAIPAGPAQAAEPDANAPARVYVPYKELALVFEKEHQGVFLPYQEFERLWRAAQGAPAVVGQAPFKYLISTARFTGHVADELAVLRLELTIDVLADEWIEMPIGLADVGVSKASLSTADSNAVAPLLRVVNGQYMLVTKGRGRHTLAVDFVRQLGIQPGLAVLKYRIPTAAITTLELVIPEENLKVDVAPMLAAGTTQVTIDDQAATRVQAFLGSAQEVTLSWKPKTEAAVELEPVLICEQLQHIDVTEALIAYSIQLDYSIRRGGVDVFSVQLPAGFRVTDVGGANIAKWDVAADPNARPSLKVGLFAPARDAYRLTIRMERFLQESSARLDLAAVVCTGVLRSSGLLAVTSSPRRSVHLDRITDLARVDTGQLPEAVRGRPGVTAYRFIGGDYAAVLAVETTSPRISLNQNWLLGVDLDRLELRGRLRYKVERTGLFELTMQMPEPWAVQSVGPSELVDDYDLKGTGPSRVLHVLLKQERIGDFELQIYARTGRDQAAGDVEFALPLPDANNLQLYEGQLLLAVAEQLQAELGRADQLQAIPAPQVESWTSIAGLSPAMGFEFRAVDRLAAAGAVFKVSVKPVQISATVHRLVDIQPGAVDQQAIVQYHIRYAPADTFYIKMPAALADDGVQITGPGIKEKPRIDSLPADQQTTADDPNDKTWAYYRISLQSKVSNSYQLTVQSRRPFQAGELGKPAVVEVPPILAAGRLSNQNGYIAVAKAETLAIGEPNAANLVSGDPGSAQDLPWPDHRQRASLAFRYNAPPFALSLPVVAQKEAKVFTTIVNGVIIEQILARDHMLNTHATFVLATSQGERLPVRLPAGAELTAVLLNGDEAPVEMGIAADERIIRMPPSAGQVSRFVLEIAYGLKNASPSDLQAPALPPEIPVQQTLWRLWLPQDYVLLGHKRVFSLLQGWQLTQMVSTLAQEQPAPVQLKLAGQGRAIDFVRQGSPGVLSVTAWRGEWFAAMVWGIILLAGVVMLKLGGFTRLVVLVAAAVIGGLLNFIMPMFIERAARTGLYAALLVAVLWFGQWVFVGLSGLSFLRSGRRQKAESPPPAEQPAAGPESKNEPKPDKK